MSNYEKRLENIARNKREFEKIFGAKDPKRKKSRKVCIQIYK